MSNEVNENTTFFDKDALRAYALENMPKKNDYSILMPGDLEKIIDTLIKLEAEYMNSIEPDADGDLLYDDDEAFDMLKSGLMEAFPQYKTFCEAMTDDYMDISESFLSEAGDIEWE